MGGILIRDLSAGLVQDCEGDFKTSFQDSIYQNTQYYSNTLTIMEHDSTASALITKILKYLPGITHIYSRSCILDYSKSASQCRYFNLGSNIPRLSSSPPGLSTYTYWLPFQLSTCDVVVSISLTSYRDVQVRNVIDLMRIDGKGYLVIPD